MFFRGLFKAGVLFSLFLFFSSCGLSVNEKAPQAIPMVIPQASLGCSVNIFEQKDSFFQGAATEEEIQSFWNCSQTAIRTFMTHTRGASEGLYEASELRNFLETYFLDSRPISPSLFNEFMGLRVAIMGGSKDVVQKKDLESLISFLQVIRQEMIRMRPYMPLEMNKVGALNESELEKFLQDAGTSFKNIGEFFYQFSGSYRFSSLDTLVRGLGTYFKEAKETETIAAAALNMVEKYQIHQKMIKLFKKTIIFESDPDIITPKDFQNSFKTVALFLDVFIRYTYWQQKFDLNFQDKGLEFFIKLTDRFQNLVGEVLKNSSNETLYFSVMDEWVDLFNEKKWIPFELTPVSIKNILRPIVQKLFGGQDNSQTGRNSKGLTYTAFMRTFKEVQQWAVGQRFLKELYLENDSILPSIQKKDLLTRAYELKLKLVQQHPENRFIYDDIMGVIRRQRPLFYGSEPYILFPHGHMSSHTTLTLRFLSQIHWLRCLGRITIAGYTADLLPKSPYVIGKLGLSMNEFQNLYRDLTEIGIQLKFTLDGNTSEDYVNHTDSGSKRFRESNLFMSLSDGGHYAHLDEAAEYFSFLFAIKATSDIYYSEFSEKCGTFLKEDVYGYQSPFIEAACFRSEFYKRLTTPENYSTLNFGMAMPRLVTYFNQLTRDEKRSFIEKLENAARVHLTPEDPFQRADLESYVMILQYVETAFLKYDINSDEVLDEHELKKAFSVFYVALKEIIEKELPKGFLQKIVNNTWIKIDERTAIYIIYHYLIYYMEPPSKNIYKAVMQIFNFIDKKVSPKPGKKIKLEATRITFFTIMSALAKTTIQRNLKDMGPLKNEDKSTDVILPDLKILEEVK